MVVEQVILTTGQNGHWHHAECRDAILPIHSAAAPRSRSIVRAPSRHLLVSGDGIGTAALPDRGSGSMAWQCDECQVLVRKPSTQQPRRPGTTHLGHRQVEQSNLPAIFQRRLQDLLPEKATITSCPKVLSNEANVSATSASSSTTRIRRRGGRR